MSMPTHLDNINDAALNENNCYDARLAAISYCESNDLDPSGFMISDDDGKHCSSLEDLIPSELSSWYIEIN